MSVDGILLVDKPAGMTSHDVVSVIRRTTGQKAGHTGTLDPLATGLLVVGLGAATKAFQYLPEENKTYCVEACLGIATDTQDRTGRVTEERTDFELPLADLRRAIERLPGDLVQVPPMYSAVQVHGQRLYRLARAGLEIDRPARKIKVTEAHLDWPREQERPLLHHGDSFGFTISAGKGLYARTVCHDLGRTLGCGAHLTELRRLASGAFVVEQAVPLSELTLDVIMRQIIPLGSVLRHLPEVLLDSRSLWAVSHGQTIEAGALPASRARAVSPEGATVAILERSGDLWRPVKVFLAET